MSSTIDNSISIALAAAPEVAALSKPQALPEDADFLAWVCATLDVFRQGRATLPGSDARCDGGLMPQLDARLDVSISLVGEAAMTQLNGDFRHKPLPTNVLSFPAAMPALPADDGGLSMQPLGDLVFCPEVIKREAGEQAESLRAHWTHLTVHGTLHLCGFDHVETDDAEAMESLEIQILSGLGVHNPYRQQPAQPDE